MHFPLMNVAGDFETDGERGESGTEGHSISTSSWTPRNQNREQSSRLVAEANCHSSEG